MKRFTFSIAALAALTVLFASGCGYFNTFYNAQKQFADAERDTRAQEKQARQQQEQSHQQQSSQSSQHPNTPAPGAPPAGAQGAAADKYRKVIETSSRMLEDYPKSRWADDALFIMGVSYFRLGDMPRAERKFTELLTLFPNSDYVPRATAWKARSLAQQKKKDDAIQLLQTGLPLMKPGPVKAGALYLMGTLLFEQERYSDAADYFKKSADMRQPKADRITALYNYALAKFNQNIFGEARNAFAEVARETRDIPQAYDAWIRCSQCEVALHDNTEAEAILQRLTTGERFMDYADDVPLELAKLAVETGRVDDGIRLYQDFIVQHTNGDRRGLAFYRLALVQRDQKADLQAAKALLDSSGKAGASHDIADSARAAMDQISKGLITMEKIKALQNDIRTIQARLDTMGVPRLAITESALLAYEDSLRIREAARKPAKPKAPEAPAVASGDSTQLAAVTPATPDTTAHAPAANRDSSAHAPKLAAHVTHKDSVKSAEKVVVAAKKAEIPSHATALAKRTLSLLDSNQTWDAARIAFRAMSPEDRLGLRTLTHAIATRDSSLGEGNGDHAHRVQLAINRAYGVGTAKVPVISDTTGAKRPEGQPAIPPKVREQTRQDSSKTLKVAGSGESHPPATAPKEAKADTLNRPRTSYREPDRGDRYGLRGYRSTPESPGQSPPDSGGKGSAGISTPPFPPPSPGQDAPRPPIAVHPMPHDTLAKPVLPADTVHADTTGRSVLQTDSTKRDTASAAPASTNVDQMRTQLLAKHRELQLAYLHAAEFYEFNLGEPDSALSYYQMAAASPVNADVFWRANLYLGGVFSANKDTTVSDTARVDSLSEEAARYYRIVLNADSVPADAANAMRAALKLPLVEAPVPAQVTALRDAEKAQFMDSVSVDSVLGLYSRVIAMDSTSKEGKRALFAKASLLELRAHHFDQARIVYEKLLSLNPDTAMARIARAKLAPPDSNSIFNLSDAELAGKHEAVEALRESKQDDNGWPPTEESLRGRHFR